MKNTAKNRIKTRKAEKDYLVIGNMNCILNDILAELRKIERAFGYTQEQFEELRRNGTAIPNVVEDDYTKEYTDAYGNLIRRSSKGNLHSLFSPAIEYANGDKAWYKDGKYHREDGPAVEDVSGYKAWYLNGKRHREDGPAIEDANEYKFWYFNGKLHREDGPAIERADGYKEWFYRGNLYGKNTNDYTQEKFEEDLRKEKK